MRIAFAAEAEADLSAAHDFYESEREGLGGEFLDEMETIVQAIAKMPNRFPTFADQGARRALGTRFPFRITFFVLEDHVRITGFFHQHQHPDTWKKRT